jgi:RND family efflux transporter MFP subunit
MRWNMWRAGSVVVGGVALAGLLGGCGALGAGQATNAPSVATVRSGTIAETVEASGQLAAAKSVGLSFATGGAVTEVLAQEGDAVTVGQVIAKVDARDLELALASAQANLDSARGSLDSARVGLRQAGAGPSAADLEQARIGIDKAKDARWSAQSGRDAICGAVAEKRRDQYECDAAEAGVLQAEDGVRQAQLAYDTLAAGPDADEVATAQAAVTRAQAQVKSAETAVAQARLKLEAATLTAPIQGTLTSLALVAGEQTATGSTVAEVADLSKLAVTVQLDELSVAAVQAGQPVTVTLEALPDVTLAGQVERVGATGTSASGVVLFPVTVAVNPGGAAVRAGMTADLVIVTAESRAALVVPRAAVATANGQSYVQRLADGGTGSASTAAAAGSTATPKTERVAVVLGVGNDNEVAVTGALAAGDRILASATGTGTAGGGTSQSGPPMAGGITGAILGGGGPGGAP